MKKFVISIVMACMMSSAFAEPTTGPKLTREQILNMTTEELSELSLEDLMEAVETLGVSSVDELFALIMNKNVSSASKSEEDSFTSPLSSTVITRDEMRTYGINSIEEAFRLIPGMIVSEKVNGVYDIQMRGLNNIPDNNFLLYGENSNMLLMVDGRQIMNFTLGAINFEMLPISIEDIDRIEVVRGACSAMYGANAVSGVVNILTERPNKDSDMLSGRVQMGNNEMSIGELAIRKAFNNKIAAGVTFNIDSRKRNIDKQYVLPKNGLYYSDPIAFNAAMNAIGATTGSKILKEDFGTIMATLQPINADRLYNTTDIVNIKQLFVTPDGSYRVFDAVEPETDPDKMYETGDLARKTIGVNGYLNFTPSKDINVYITGGYQNSEVMSTPMRENPTALNVRTSKTAYVNLDASVYGAHLAAGYSAGPQDNAVGVPGFKEQQTIANILLDYDLKLNCGLGIRPGIEYQYVKAEDYSPVYTDRNSKSWKYEDPGYTYKKGDYGDLTGFFSNKATIRTIAPSIKLDYKLNNLRLIGAYRADKTNIPDSWQHSWQFAANYKINENNFVRMVYGRSNRGTTLLNSGANFEWHRTNMVYPSILQFVANEDASLVKIDNIELGYRWKPTNKILIDAEAFFSKSSDFGAMMANFGAEEVTQEEMTKVMYALAEAYQMMGGSEAFKQDETLKEKTLLMLLNQNDMAKVLIPYASIKYNTLPYEVKQIGISMNMDWIISPKLIAKINANVQNTKIDNYFTYDMNAEILAMINESQNRTMSYTVDENGYHVVGELADLFYDITKEYMNGKNLQEAGDVVFAGIDPHTGQPIYNVDRGMIRIGQTPYEEIRNKTSRELKDGVKHQATPSVYGMIGLIYKPLQQLEISAFSNFVGKQTYKSKYGEEKINNRCSVNMKIGYKPVSQIEIFFDGKNILNNEKKEYMYGDKIGGTYTVGANFKF